MFHSELEVCGTLCHIEVLCHVRGYMNFLCNKSFPKKVRFSSQRLKGVENVCCRCKSPFVKISILARNILMP